ncbi:MULTISPECIES: helix-turn-helix domain-containing protein [Roseibium]|uniref:Crp/Fnr family transcriptional regulator n=1 Tax=Roseibium TaxID=150830 RepID=UPI001AD8E45B|nr:helix-turn-helix domain-containing protein [Roseibium polysiphoniae]
MAYLEHEANGQYGAARAAARPMAVATQPTFEAFGAKLTKFGAHDVVYYEGDEAKRLYQLASGTIMLFKLLPDGRRQVVEILRPGDIFGLSAGEEQDCTAETLTEATVREVDLKQVEASVDLQRQLTKCLTNQMNILHEHAVLLGRKSAVERVASFLMYLVPNRGGGVGCVGPDPSKSDDGCDLQLHMTRQEIADYLGLTIETVSRVVSDLKRRGVIRIDRSDKIHLNRICGLCQMTGIH